MNAAHDDAWYRAVVEAFPHYVWTSDLAGRLTYVDPRLLALMGVPESEAVGADWAQRVHPDERQEAVRAWRAAIASGREFKVEYRLQRADGEYRWFATRARPAFGPDGEAVQWIGTLDDIHAEVGTRELLRLEQQRLSKMASASPQMLYSFWSAPDGRARFPYVSPAFVALFQIDPEALARDATPFFLSANPEDAPAIIAAVQASERDLTVWRHVWRARTPSLGERWLEAHSAPVREADGSTTWHGTVSDITDRRRAEDEVRELNAHLEQRVAQRTRELEFANRELELANRELEAFSYSVSHDLREPLRAVNGFSRALLEDFGAQLPSEAHQLLDSVRQGGLRMGRLIDDLLAFSRLSRQPLRRRPVDVRATVGACLKELAAGDNTRATVVVGELHDCEADAALLRQVFLNLIGNAFKYSRKRAEPRIEIHSSRGADSLVTYSIQDNGVGFNMKYAHKLFQVFQRLHRPSDFEGSGVGLAIVHRIVVRHGGRVWCDATLDQGASFHFTLSGGELSPPA